MIKYPLIRFVILFAAGILLDNYFATDLKVVYLVSAFLILLSVTLIYFNRYNFIRSVIVYLLSFSTGIIIHQNFNAGQNELLPQDIYKQKDFTASGIVTDVELQREKEIVFNCTTDSININKFKFVKEVKLICKLRDESKRKLDSVYAIIYPGNKISITGTYSKGREERNPGEFDYNKYLNEQGISGIVAAYNIKDFAQLDNEKQFIKSLIFDARKYLDRQITMLHEPATAALLKGLILADRTEIDFETKTNFINSGVIHVLAVSGLHVGYIMLIFIFLFGRFNPYLRASLTIAVLILFMLITGVPPSVFRATVMAVIIIVSLLTNRSSNIYNSLAFAALIILILNPNELFNPGFQLSFSAVISIAAIYPVIQTEINKWKIKNSSLKAIILFAGVSFSAQIGTMPFTLAYFHKLSLIALVVNIVVIPGIGIILGTAFFTLIINIITFTIAAIPASFNEFVTGLIFRVVNYAGSFDYSFLPIKQFSLIDSLFFYFFIIIAFAYFKLMKSLLIKTVFVVIICSNIILFSSFDDKDILSPDELNVFMIDIGQGDAALLKFPNGETALIDAGETTIYFDNGERIILPLLNQLGIDKIDYGFISHMDTDHYSGFVSLINYGVIKTIYKFPVDSTLELDVKFEKYTRSKNIPIKYYEQGKINIGAASIFVLSGSAIPFFSSLSINDKSSLIKVVYGKTSFLFTGDIGKKAEEIYVGTYKDFLKADVLKVGHHGSITSSSLSFISCVRPSVSLISAGIKNKFNHPSQIVLDRLNVAGSAVYRTDLQGAVLFKSNGDSVYFVNWKE